jgi:hypothetical protein
MWRPPFNIGVMMQRNSKSAQSSSQNEHATNPASPELMA